VYRAGVFAGKPVELSADELRVLDILINAEKPRRRAA
jgi:hypothetical protein